ncbi:hypothetical protein BKP37_09315 [Anaerobacillus alkalilacustris]|uniref:Lipoprotein SmpA/OmlA domain-containing protein n=1 Tax=Anaerobacillus alkalilacustris TaxID=393763 RepID=A0A1S2LNN2_9BACI|nr:hypothetical protein [Anaerobacillus alkalilacustris]OIJ13944.1 hypothetical protein BKP37_09315 [Anaerobacillus alkalilacustris]
MKNLLFFILFSSLLVLGTACSPDEGTQIPESEDSIEEKNEQEEAEKEEIDNEVSIEEETSKEEVETEQKESKQEDSNLNQEESASEVDQDIVTLLKGKAIVGKEINDVKQLLGEPNVNHKDTIMHAWRYDYTEDGYKYSNELISVDVAGLTERSMNAQVFVYFENNKVSSVSIYYFTDEDIMHYRETKEGFEEYSASAD